MDWTEEKIAELTRLWGEGHSTAEIGRRMGCTKNVIVGKAHRLGLPARQSPINSEARTLQAAAKRAQNLAAAVRLKQEGYSAAQISRQLGLNRETAGKMLRDAGHGSNGGRRHALKPGAALPGLVAVPAEPSAPVAAHPLVRLGGGCRWPDGDPRKAGFRFCERPDVVQGKPYCEEHCAKAYDRTGTTAGFFVLKRLGRAA